MPDISKEAYDQLVRARCALILNQPFFGTLALRLQLKEDNSIPTLAVDGRTMFYNAQFVKSLNANLTKAAVAHEVGHCVFNHIGRRAGRDPRLWNCAGDFVINDMLKQSGFSLGEGWLYNPAYSGMTADHIYDLLKQEAGDGGGGGGGGEGPGDPLCDIRDGEGGGQIDPVLANEWKIATIQAAAAAQAQGNLPAPMKRFVDELVGSKIDWRAMLRQFIVEMARDDYSWMRSNRRFAAHGLHLPGLYSEQMGEIAVVVDTSGSIDQVTLSAFAAEIDAIRAQARPSKTYVIYCDADVQHVDEFTPTDEFKIEAHGGGGTDFRPPFTWLEERSITPRCLVYLTDMLGPFGDEPSYPVMWCATTNHQGPWGVTVPVEM